MDSGMAFVRERDWRIYIVKPGDTMSAIVRREFGDA
jgi:hypothetical protein